MQAYVKWFEESEKSVLAEMTWATPIYLLGLGKIL